MRPFRLGGSLLLLLAAAGMVRADIVSSFDPASFGSCNGIDAFVNCPVTQLDDHGLHYSNPATEPQFPNGYLFVQTQNYLIPTPKGPNDAVLLSGLYDYTPLTVSRMGGGSFFLTQLDLAFSDYMEPKPGAWILLTLHNVVGPPEVRKLFPTPNSLVFSTFVIGSSEISSFELVAGDFQDAFGNTILSPGWFALDNVTYSTDRTTVPEIDAGAAGSALGLLSGALLMLRGRRNRSKLSSTQG